MKSEQKHTVVLVEDHTLFRKGIAELIDNFDNYHVLWEASNGAEFFELCNKKPLPEIVILDIAMPIMDGFDTAKMLKVKYPQIKILVLSMFDQDEAIIKMLKLGVNGYILKDAVPSEFLLALDEIMSKGSYYSDLVSGTMARMIEINENIKNKKYQVSDQEKDFLKLVVSEFTYKEIAEKMSVSVRTVDGYRDNLFTKFNIKSRMGLALFAIKMGFVKL